MSLSLIVIAGIVAAAGGGATAIWGGISANSDNNEAKKNNQRANSMVKNAKSDLERARNASKQSIESLGNQKISVLQTSITQFIDYFERIKNIKLQNSVGLQELSKFKIDKQGIVELKDATMVAESIAKGLVGGSVAGGAVAFGAWSAATAFASASTGTAIATLSGAAANNATLAFFGGGAITAGGAGITAGTAVLGGLVAGPALAVLGIVMAANASENLEKSQINIENARKFQEEIGILCSSCYLIQMRADLFTRILIRLDLMFSPLLNQMKDVLSREGTDYRKFSGGAKKTIAAALGVAQAIKAILDTPLLDADGKLSEESQKVSAVICDKMQISA